METTVKHLGRQVILALQTASYAPSTIGFYERTIKELERFIDQHGGYYTPNLGTQFQTLTTSPKTGKFSPERRFRYTRIVALFDRLLTDGTVHLEARGRGGGGPTPTTTAFTKLTTEWETYLNQRDLSRATQEAYGRVAREYLVFLETHGTDTITSATAPSVTGFLENLVAGNWAPSSLFWVVSNFRPFLNYLQRDDLVEAIKLAHVHRPHRVVPVLTQDSVDQVLTACTTPGMVPPRDAAITLLALTTGLRACDIVNLRLNNIDWHTLTVSIIQQKTGNPVTVPLTEAVAAPLAEYILNTRPRVNDDHVFLRTLAPFTPFGDHGAVHRIITMVMNKSGVPGPVGSRMLRHTAASRLMRAATPLPTISAVLGHARQESTTVYLQVDDERLLQCVLPLPDGARS